MKPLKLDKIDQKLITYIFHGFRDPLTKIIRDAGSQGSRSSIGYMSL